MHGDSIIPDGKDCLQGSLGCFLPRIMSSTQQPCGAMSLAGMVCSAQEETETPPGHSLNPVAFHSLPSPTPITRSNHPKPWATSGQAVSAPRRDQWSQSAAPGTAHTPDSSQALQPDSSSSDSPSQNKSGSSTASSTSRNSGRSSSGSCTRNVGRSRPDNSQR